MQLVNESVSSGFGIIGGAAPSFPPRFCIIAGASPSFPPGFGIDEGASTSFLPNKEIEDNLYAEKGNFKFTLFYYNNL